MTHKPPCFNTETNTDCPDRAFGCHGTCERWKQYEEAKNADYELRAKAAKAMYECNSKAKINAKREALRNRCYGRKR